MEVFPHHPSHLSFPATWPVLILCPCSTSGIISPPLTLSFLSPHGTSPQSKHRSTSPAPPCTTSAPWENSRLSTSLPHPSSRHSSSSSPMHSSPPWHSPFVQAASCPTLGFNSLLCRGRHRLEPSIEAHSLAMPPASSCSQVSSSSGPATVF